MSDAYSFVRGMQQPPQANGAGGAVPPSPSPPPAPGGPGGPGARPRGIDPGDMRLPPGAAAALAGLPTVSMTIRRTTPIDRVKVVTVPPEEFLVSPDATSEDDALYIGQRREMRVSDLVAMGYDYDAMIAAISEGFQADNQEATERNPALSSRSDPQLDPSMRKVFYTEGLIRLDSDGDGIAELLKVCTVGDHNRIVNMEPAEEVNFALFSPSPEPHTIIGKSIADETMDLQRIKTNLMRFALDGLAQSIVPRTAYNSLTVNADDIVSNEVGAHIRVKGSPASEITPISSDFPADQALGMLNYIDEIKASRTGVSKASQGLDPDALQGTTATAVNATVSAAEMRQEVIARFFGETLKRCFRGLLKLVIRHQDRPKMVRLRNKFIEIDPRSWNADMDVNVNVAIGTSRREEKIAAYAAIAQKQEQILQLLGPDNVLCDIGQLRNSYAKMLELIGEKDVPSFFKEVTPDDVAAAKQAQGQNDPAKAQNEAAIKIAEAEGMKAQADMITARTKPLLEKQKNDMEQDFKRDELESQVIIKGIDLALKHGVNPAVMIQLIFQAMARPRQSQPMPMIPPGIDMGGGPGSPPMQPGPPLPPPGLNGGAPPPGMPGM